jgi:hypothetical protein
MVILDHVGRLHVRVIDRVALSNERQRRLVVRVGASSLHLQARFGQQLHRLASAIALLLASRDTPLGGFERPFGMTVPGRMEDARLIREGSERLDAKINSRLLASLRQGPHGRRRSRHMQPSASCDTVSVLGVPSRGRDQRTAIRPILDRTRNPLSSVAPLPTSLSAKERQRSGLE